WLLKSLLAFFAVAVVVIFQPELRRALAELGSQRWFFNDLSEGSFVENLAETALHLANKQVGALIAIERGTNLREDLQSGVEIDALFSRELMETIFHPRTILHDGGVIVHGGRIAAAGCIFPVSQRENLDRTLGLRHRAGLGLAEETDAVVIVVSEETGAISLCCNGKIERNLSPHAFRKLLGKLLLDQAEDAAASQLGNEARLSGGGVHDLAHHQESRERQRPAV
ncbi:MAG: diadenylate cyclase, partial [Verrucomicrobiia bacterium]